MQRNGDDKQPDAVDALGVDTLTAFKEVFVWGERMNERQHGCSQDHAQRNHNSCQPELSPRASPWAMPGSSKENTVAASMTPAAELSSMSRARIDKSLIVQIIKAPSNVPTLANRLARLPATIMLLSYSIMVLQQKYKYGLNGLRVAG